MKLTGLLSKVSAGRSEVSIAPDWMQGRAAYGGLVSALVYESMRKSLASDVPVRCLQVSFIGPVSAEPLELSSEVLRQGKSVTQVLGRGIQNGETKVAILGSFGASRASQISVSEPIKTFDRTPGQATQLPYIENVTPVFTQHFDYRYCSAFPFSGTDSHTMRGYVRYKDVEPEMNEAHLIGLIDAWPPTTLPMLKTPAMASSLSWTMEFIQPQIRLGSDEFSLYESTIVQSANGYGHTRAKIWNSQGELLAISQQTVTHFA